MATNGSSLIGQDSGLMNKKQKIGQDDDDDDGQINQDLLKLVTGKAVPVGVVDFNRKDAVQFVPKTKVNTCYIMMTVLFNEHNQVLLVQEAKQSCRGTWYLPAGRLEPNENFVDGAKREVKEEAGLECDMVTLLSLHFGNARWTRLSFLGKVTGGQLKTLEEKDEESLQALFYDISSVMDQKIPLRSGDIIPVIQQAQEYRQAEQSVPLHPVLHPVIAGHSLLIHRCVLVVDIDHGTSFKILAGLKGRPHIVTCAITPKDFSLVITAHAFMKRTIAVPSVLPGMLGILGVEHCGVSGDTDGLCITTLVSLSIDKDQELPAIKDDSFAWLPITDEICIRHIHGGLNGRIVKLIDRQH